MNKEEFLDNIRKVIETGAEWSDESAHFPAEDTLNWLKEFGMEVKEGLESNGWQWDWWITLTFKGKDYSLGGSGYYGGLSFQPV